MNDDICNEDLRLFAAVLVQAAAGAKVQAHRRNSPDLDWQDKRDFGTWLVNDFEYRIKPSEPKEVWVNMHGRISWAYLTEDMAYEHASPNHSYDGIAVHFKEVINEDVG